MKVKIIDWVHDPHPRVFEGTPDEIEQILRERFRSFTHGIEHGDLYALAKEIGRSYIQITFLDEKPEPKPHLHPKEKRRVHEDPWIREADFSKHMALDEDDESNL